MPHAPFSLLAGLESSDRAHLESLGKTLTFAAEDVVLDQGVPAPGLFVLTSGTVRVDRHTPDTELTVATLEAGEVFGEISFLEGGVTTARVISEGASDVLVLDRAALERALAEVPGLAARLFRGLATVLAGRLRDTTAALPGVLIHEIPQINDIHAERTGAATDLPQGFVDEVEQFKTEMISLSAELAKETGAANAVLIHRAIRACEQLNAALTRFCGAHPEKGKALGTFLLRETFPYLMQSRLVDRSFNKPRGYAGDFLTIHMLYENQAEGDGRLGPLIDRWALGTRISEANRDRLTYVGALVRGELANWHSATAMPVTSLAAGSARELTDIFADSPRPNFFATCIDIDPEASAFAARQAKGRGAGDSFRFAVDNVVKLSLGGGKVQIPTQQVIYSLGLTDYLQDKLVVKLLDWMHDHLLPGGVAMIGNHDPGNPERALMEHVLDWGILYRSADDLRGLFAKSKFGSAPVDVTLGSSQVQLFARCRRSA